MAEIDLQAIMAESAKATGAASEQPAPEGKAPDGQADETGEAATPPADAAAEKPEGEEGDGEQPKPEKPRGGFQKRISELTREKHEAKREAQELRDLLSKALGGQQKAEAAPEQSDEPRPEQFNKYEDYVTAKAEWKADQRIKTVLGDFAKQQSQQTREQSVQASYQALETRVLKQAKTDPEVGEAFEAIKTGAVEINPATAEYIREVSDDPGQLMKYLVNNEDEAARISRLNPIAAVKELAKAEARLSAKPKPKTSSAPPPPATLTGGAAAPQSIERMGHADVLKWVREQDAKR